MIVVMSCIDSTVVIVVWCRGPAMAMSAVNGEGASVGGSAGDRPEPEQQEHTQRGATRSKEEGKQSKQAEKQIDKMWACLLIVTVEWLMRD